jgi:glycine/D-amino acid oxidase-like deaminating enzyme
MLKTVVQPVVHRGSVHVASGLTLRHYAAFQICPALSELKQRVARETPVLDRFGVHVMATQFPNGEVVVGDSHEYGGEITPFDKVEIDELILRELKKVIQLEDWTIRERWHGIYAKHPDLPVFEAEVSEGVHVFTGTGGAGMTMSFGLAERAWRQWEGAGQ